MMVGEPSWTRSPIALTKKQAKILVWIGFPLAMMHLIDYCCQISPNQSRDLDVIDFFSGQGSVYRAYSEQELAAKYFEIEQNPLKHDLNSVPGLCQAILYTLRAKPNSLALGGPPCGSFVWINLSTSGRSRDDPFGNCDRQYVASANKLTARWTLLLLLCAIRSVFTLTEQPSSSMMFLLPYFKFLVKALKRINILWHRIFLHMGSYGSMTMKPTKLWGTAPFAVKMRRKISKATRRRVARTSKKVQMVKKSTKNGRTSVSGGNYLKKSAAYPRRFGRAICYRHQSYIQEHQHPQAIVGATFDKERPLKAPLGWQHADLESVKKFLLAEIANGTYKPILPLESLQE
mmetsp:Transcript_79355/g.125158  ORF Transcript_79355/g.125158 Transcript_79355/m.125158 type:complete len:346 (-) Transcript_79355:158-1195(-)